MENERIRFFGNVHVGVDLKVDELRQFYDAIIFATGAERDRSLDIPGDGPARLLRRRRLRRLLRLAPRPRADLGPDPAASVAVIGVGNVGLDVARMLARTGDELLSTEIPRHVHGCWPTRPSPTCTCSPGAARRRPSSPRWSCASWTTRRTSQVVVAPEGMEFDAGSQAAIARSQVAADGRRRAHEWAMREPEPGPHRRIHIHFLENPVEVLGEDGRVVGLRTERQELTGDGNVRGTGEYTRLGRAGGLPGGRLPLRADRGPAVRHRAGSCCPTRRPGARPGRRAGAGHLRDRLGQARAGRPDRAHQVRRRRDRREPARPTRPALDRAPAADDAASIALLAEKGLPVTDFDGWDRLDAHERSLGEPASRERIKVLSREEMIRVAGTR